MLSSLFYSIAVDGKKEFRKYLCLTLYKRLLLWLLVACVDKALKIILNYENYHLFEVSKQEQFLVLLP